MKKRIRDRIYLILLVLVLVVSVAIAKTSSSSINWLSKPHADTLYEPIHDDKFMMYFTTSMKNKTIWNFSEADNNKTIIEVDAGEHYVFGGKVQ